MKPTWWFSEHGLLPSLLLPVVSRRSHTSCIWLSTWVSFILICTPIPFTLYLLPFHIFSGWYILHNLQCYILLKLYLMGWCCFNNEIEMKHSNQHFIMYIFKHTSMFKMFLFLLITFYYIYVITIHISNIFIHIHPST